MTVTKLGVGLVTQGLIQAKTACALIVALLKAGVPFDLLLAEGCYIHQNRQIAVNMARDHQCSHILFVDSDMFFPSDAIKRLIDDDKEIVGGRYNKRILPLESTVKQDISTLSAVPFVPTGFLLINMQVFDRISKPYFFFEDAPDSSEDLYFCKKAQAAGYTVWCDPTITIGHLGTAVF